MTVMSTEEETNTELSQSVREEPAYTEKIKENIFTKLGVTRPYTVFVAIAIVCILGVFAFSSLRVELFPNMNLPFVMLGTSLTPEGSDEIESDVRDAVGHAV